MLRATEIAPGYVFLVFLLASSAARADMAACRSAYVKKTPDEQIELYTKCVASGEMSRSNVSAALGNRGLAYLAKRDYERALADFNKSIEFDARFGVGYLHRARVHMLLGDLTAANADLTAAIKWPPARLRAYAYALRGVVRQYQEDSAGALSDLDRAMQMDPKLAWAYSAKAWLLATSEEDHVRKGSEALALAQKAIELQDHWKAHDTLAAAYAELGRFEDAMREMQLALDNLDADGAERGQELQARRALYESKQPYRESLARSRKLRVWNDYSY